MKTIKSLRTVVLILVLSLVAAGCGGNNADTNNGATAESLKPVELLNVSYDPTRELYVEYNKAFAAYWKAEKNQEVTIKQSHGVPLHIEILYNEYQFTASFAVASLLVLLAFVTLVVKSLVEWKTAQGNKEAEGGAGH